MNAEPTNLTGGSAQRKSSAGNIVRALLVVVPFFGLASVGLTYTDLNIHQRKFVDVLGCGCAPSFNTNDLTDCVGFLAMSMTLAA